MKGASIPELLAGVVTDAKDIATGHATKMRSEIADEFAGLKRYLMKVAITVGLGVLGAILLSHSFALGLDALGMPQWAAYLIAAAVFLGIGMLLIHRMPSDKKSIDLIPENSFADFKRDVSNITDDVKNEMSDSKSAHVH